MADGRLVGCTRFLEMRRWRGRPEPDEVEIGGTWLAADVQRSAVNTEAKLLLLTQAFDDWHVDRVAIATDARNDRSRHAIERIGARSRASCATTGRRWCPARPAGPATRRCSP